MIVVEVIELLRRKSCQNYPKSNSLQLILPSANFFNDRSPEILVFKGAKLNFLLFDYAADLSDVIAQHLRSINLKS